MGSSGATVPAAINSERIPGMTSELPSSVRRAWRRVIMRSVEVEELIGAHQHARQAFPGLRNGHALRRGAEIGEVREKKRRFPRFRWTAIEREEGHFDPLGVVLRGQFHELRAEAIRPLVDE